MICRKVNPPKGKRSHVKQTLPVLCLLFTTYLGLEACGEHGDAHPPFHAVVHEGTEDDVRRRVHLAVDHLRRGVDLPRGERERRTTQGKKRYTSYVAHGS